jgi:hypothetical protein
VVGMVFVGVDVTVGLLVTVTVLVLVLVLVDGGGTAVVVVIVVTLVVVEVEGVVVADAAAITPHANRLPESAVGLLLPKLVGFWWMTSAVPELFRRSAAVNELVVVTSFAEPSGRTCNAVRSPLAGYPVWPGAW